MENTPRTVIGEFIDAVVKDPVRAASLLAARMDVDLHFAIDLLRNGCAPELALQILL